MSVTSNSKGTIYDTHCGNCNEKIVIRVRTQRLPKPKHCPFCRSWLLAGEFTVDRIENFKA